MTAFKSVLREKPDCNQSKAIPTFFFRLASNAFPDIGSVSRIEYVFGLIKCTIYCKKIFLFLFLFFFMLLLCSFSRLKELFQVKNGLTTSLPFFFFFLIMPKIWVGRTTLNGEKRASPNVLKNTPSRHYRILEHGYIFKILQVNGQDNIPKLVLDINLYRS